MTTQQEYKEKYFEFAKQASADTGIFPETILAASALESGWAKSDLAKIHFNFFGIKAGKEWAGKTVMYPTREQTKEGKVFVVNAAFRKYDTPADSFKNYVKFISGPRYVKAGVTTAKTPQAQFAALQKAGYATDISYSQKLLQVLNAFNKGLAKVKQTVISNPATSAATVATFFFSLI